MLSPRYQIWSPTFTKLNDEFARLKNVELSLRNEDGDFAEVERLAIHKRKGTANEGDEIHSSNRIHSQLYFKNKTLSEHLAFSGTNLYKKLEATLATAITSTSTTITVDSTTDFASSGSATIGGDKFDYTGITATTFTGVTNVDVSHAADTEAIQWDSIHSSLTSDEVVGGVSVESYGGTAVVSAQSVDENITGSWTAEETYDAVAGTTTFNNSGGGFPTDDSLIGWFVYPNITDDQFKGISYVVLAHTATKIVVAGEVTGTFSAKTYKILTTSTTTRLLDSSQSWTQDAYKGYWVVITTGKGLGQSRRISANEANYMTIGLPWDITPDSTSKYSIYNNDNDDNILYFGNSTDGLHKYDGTTVNALSGRPKGHIIGSYQDRLFVSGDSNHPFTIHYSQVGNPEYFDSTFLIRPKGADIITGFTVWNKKGIIFKKRSVWAFEFVYNEVTNVYGVTLEEVPSATGCVNSKAFTNIADGEIWFYDGKEVNMLGASPSQIGVLRTKSISFPINGMLKNVTPTQAESAVMENDGTIVRLSIPDAGLFFEYNLEYGVWITRTGNTAASLLIDVDGDWFYGGSTGQVYSMDLDHYADGGTPGLEPSGGTAIDMTVATKALDFGSRSTYKNYRYIDYVFENESTSTTYTVWIHSAKYKFKYSKEKAVGFSTGSSGDMLGESELGETTFGGANPAVNTFRWRVSIGRDPGVFAIIEIRNNTVDENLKLIGVECTYKTRGLKHFPNQFIT